MDTTAFDLSPAQADIQARACAFGEKWAPLATHIDREDCAPIADVVRDTVDIGLVRQFVFCIDFALVAQLVEHRAM
ncbi:hypothetical protein ACW2Q0_20390 [Nocardia sp. R16R-3T]